MSESRKVWLEAGLELLVESGPRKLTVAAACAEVGKTKGSFYHHFRDVDDFQHQLMEYWKEGHTDEPIRQSVRSPDPMKKLTQVVGKLPFSREMAFRNWAQRSTVALEIVREVDRLRVEHLKKLLEDGSRSAERAELLAWMDYALYLGVSMLESSLPAARRREIMKKFEEMMSDEH